MEIPAKTRKLVGYIHKNIKKTVLLTEKNFCTISLSILNAVMLTCCGMLSELLKTPSTFKASVIELINLVLFCFKEVYETYCFNLYNFHKILIYFHFIPYMLYSLHKYLQDQQILFVFQLHLHNKNYLPLHYQIGFYEAQVLL